MKINLIPFFIHPDITGFFEIVKQIVCVKSVFKFNFFSVSVTEPYMNVAMIFFALKY